MKNEAGLTFLLRRHRNGLFFLVPHVEAIIVDERITAAAASDLNVVGFSQQIC